MKLCECGCGEPAPIALVTNRCLGRIKGQPMRFVYNHHNKPWTPEMRAAKFFERVDKSNGEDGCWIWMGARSTFGYGVIGWTGGGVNKVVRTHRYSYELAHGEIPEGLWVLHSCANPPCVNPRHLRLGTYAENVADTVRHGHTTQGERNAQAKLTKGDVRAIRASRQPSTKLAAVYGVSARHVRLVRSGKSWAHIKPAAVRAGVADVGR